METFKITFTKHDGTHQTVKITDIDDCAAQMIVILNYAVKQIVKVEKV